MRFSTCLALFGLSAGAFATPTSQPEDVSAITERTVEWGPVVPVGGPSNPFKGGQRPDSYGRFSRPVVPPVPTNKPKPYPGSNFNCTSDDVKKSPWWPHSPDHRGHWFSGYNINTDTEASWPNTGRTVRYTLTITNSSGSPDGVSKPMMLVNEQYPGPLIEANWGDWLEITVVNKLTTNGTSMHWHGLRQLKTNLADGAGGVTECPIAPGDSRVYRFQATEYGSSWYHSHFSVQYGDGVVGPIIINGPSSANYDIDLGTFLVTDFYSGTAPQEDWFAHRKGPPKARNYLINGKNAAVDGSTGKRAQFTFTPGKKHLLRFVSTSLDHLFKMSIDGHKLKVVQTDFVPIVPYETNEVAMAVAQRYHVIVEANQAPGNYFLRAMVASDCGQNSNDGTGTANAIISYSNFKNSALLPNSTATNHTNTCVDEPIASLVPVVSKSVDSTGFLSTVQTKDVDISVQTNPEFVFFWTLGGVSEVMDWNKPVIAQAAAGNNTYEQARNIVILNQTNAWTYFVIQNRFFVPHPMHLHGHDFNLLGQGNGIFNPSTDMSKLNFINPPRRDTALLVASGWSVIAFKTDNPGAWLLHCHIAWHAGEGLSLNFMERPQDIPSTYRNQVMGTEFQRTCKNWNKYQENAVWKQYDSGLKRRAPDGLGQVIDWSASKFIKAKERMYAKREGNVVRATI